MNYLRRLLRAPAHVLSRLRRLDDVLDYTPSASSGAFQSATSHATSGANLHHRMREAGPVPIPGPWGFLTSGYFFGLFFMVGGCTLLYHSLFLKFCTGFRAESCAKHCGAPSPPAGVPECTNLPLGRQGLLAGSVPLFVSLGSFVDIFSLSLPHTLTLLASQSIRSMDLDFVAGGGGSLTYTDSGGRRARRLGSAQVYGGRLLDDVPFGLSRFVRELVDKWDGGPQYHEQFPFQPGMSSYPIAERR